MIILHIDLDAFYAQVEQIRLKLDASVPLAVLQWNGLLAVNYAARKFNIKRHSTPQDALALCPEIRLVHVATFNQSDSTPQYYENPSYHSHKVSLDFYRRASKQIFSIFNRFASNLERASCDEAFIDLTALIHYQISSNEYRQILNIPDTQADDDFTCIWTPDLGVLIGDQVTTTTEKIDLELCLAAHYCLKIRLAVFNELGYTCSAGISLNKMLAKLGSGLNKPMKQTVIRDSQVLDFMKDLSLSSIRSLGGNFILI